MSWDEWDEDEIDIEEWEDEYYWDEDEEELVGEERETLALIETIEEEEEDQLIPATYYPQVCDHQASELCMIGYLVVNNKLHEVYADREHRLVILPVYGIMGYYHPYRMFIRL